MKNDGALKGCRNRLTRADSVRFITLVTALPIKVEPEAPLHIFEDVMALARDHNLSTYDAGYLDLAMRHGLALASQNKALLQAARKCKVPVYKPE